MRAWSWGMGNGTLHSEECPVLRVDLDDRHANLLPLIGWTPEMADRLLDTIQEIERKNFWVVYQRGEKLPFGVKAGTTVVAAFATEAAAKAYVESQ